MGLAEALLDTYGLGVSQLTLIPSMGGVLEVKIDGQLVFSKKQLGRHPTIDEIKNQLRQKIVDGRL